MCPQVAGQTLLAKLSARDLISQEARYQPQCLATLYNKVWGTKAPESDVDSITHGIALAGLVSYIEEVHMDSLVAPVFKLMDLANIYSTRLEQLELTSQDVYTPPSLRKEYWVTSQT